MYFFVSSFYLFNRLNALYKIKSFNNSGSEYFFFDIVENNKLNIINVISENIISTKIKVNFIGKQSIKKIRIAVYAKYMIDVLNTYSNETILIKKEKNTLNIYSKQGICEIPIIIGLTNLYKTKILEYSSIKITLLSNIFLKILNNTLFYVNSNIKLKPVFNGVYFQFSTCESNFVVKDTFRLVKYSIKKLVFNKNVEFFIPKKSLNIIKKILENEKKNNIVIVYKHRLNIVFYFKHYIFSCPLINDNKQNYDFIINKNYDFIINKNYDFIINKNYDFIINKNYDVSLIIDRLLFLNSIKRISILNKFIYLYINYNELKIFEKDTINYSKMKCKSIFKNFKKIKMVFNSKFLIESLSYLNGKLIYFDLYYLNKIGILRKFTDKKGESIHILIMSTITT
ncbi:DNA polymerase III subunit beta [Blattabacterium cuenoti]|uniref:DNA polymerase III subunit beta n=1 Tax=Blattabacterium cuenoti TaxID=1653831 RepID=UPI00163D3C0B|nr:DNA polymerase III subunit beta [Blattabacterium cuenoti]